MKEIILYRYINVNDTYIITRNNNYGNIYKCIYKSKNISGYSDGKVTVYNLKFEVVSGEFNEYLKNIYLKKLEIKSTSPGYKSITRIYRIYKASERELKVFNIKKCLL